MTEPEGTRQCRNIDGTPKRWLHKTQARRMAARRGKRWYKCSACSGHHLGGVGSTRKRDLRQAAELGFIEIGARAWYHLKSENRSRAR